MGSIAIRRPNGFGARWPLATAVFLLLASACYAPLGQRAVDSQEIYRESGFSRDSLRDEGTALLPPRLSFGYETYGPPLLQGLAETLGDALAPDGLVPPNLSTSRINQAGVADDYLAMLADYDETGILRSWRRRSSRFMVFPRRIREPRAFGDRSRVCRW